MVSHQNTTGDREMGERMTVSEFLGFLKGCSGDEAMDLIEKYQSGSLIISDAPD